MCRSFTQKDPIEVRILGNLPDRPENGCWPWKGYKDARGYGMIRWHGKTYRAHSLLYMLLVRTVPPGFELDHVKDRCNDKSCCNLSHLEEVTHAENVRRGSAGQNMREKTHCPQGHPYSGDNLKINTYGKRCCRICEKQVKRRHQERRNLGLANGKKHQCPKGHPYSGDNLYVGPKGERRCRQCVRDRANKAEKVLRKRQREEESCST